MKKFLILFLIFILTFLIFIPTFAEDAVDGSEIEEVSEEVLSEEEVEEPEEPEEPTTYPFNVRYYFYGDWSSSNLIYSRSLSTQYLEAGSSFSVSNLAKNIGYSGTGYECREWFCGSIEVDGGDSRIGKVQYNINYSDYSITGTTVAGPIDIIYTYSPYNDYFYVDHYLENDEGGYDLAQTKRYAGYMYDFCGQEYQSIFLDFEGYTADESRIDTGKIVLRKAGDDTLRFRCYYTKNAVVEPSPSESPTESPTATPTATPTESPTESPTEKPTATPTVQPTEKPTEVPTKKPTEAPTEKPTSAPTATPTVKPTATPTEKPTSIPMEKPTAAPTAVPTEVPTKAPTATPKPTKKPTPKPTVIPTAEPTEEPTVEPTKEITMPPTEPPAIKMVATQDTPEPPKPTDTPEPAVEEVEEVEEEIEIEELVDIEDEEVPLAALITDNWALVNLICMILTTLGLIKFKKDRKYNFVNIAVPILSILVFVFTEFTCYPMVLVDKYTWIMVVLLFCEIVVCFISYKKEEEGE